MRRMPLGCTWYFRGFELAKAIDDIHNEHNYHYNDDKVENHHLLLVPFGFW